MKLLYFLLFLLAGNYSYAVVNITSVTATQQGNNILIAWQTVSELNNDFFTVERSTDGVSFSEIGTVSGAVNSASVQNYSHTDNNLVNGQTYFYRIKDTDLTGAFDFSDPVEIDFTSATSIAEEGGSAYELYPNPMTDYTILKFDNLNQQEFTFMLYDLQGKVVRTINDIVGDELKIMRQNLESGLYLFQLRSKDQVLLTGKLTLQ